MHQPHLKDPWNEFLASSSGRFASATVAKHSENLDNVFQRLREAHLKLKPKKCHFFLRQVSFLGHIVSEDGISTDSAKVQKIMDCPSPKDVHMSMK